MNSCKEIDISDSISSLTQLLNKIMKTNEKNWWTNLSYQEDSRKLEVFWVEMEGGFWLKKKKESRLSDEKSEENGRDF